MESPIALEIDHHSVLLGWSAVQGALAYELQMLTSSAAEENDTAADENEWKSLSSAIKGTNIRKKNLIEGHVYHFRVRCKLATGWDDFSPPADVKVLSAGTLQLEAPALLTRDTTSVTMHWSAPGGCPELEGYRLRYRAEDSLQWTYVEATLKSTQAKKKGLAPGVVYYFSVLPVVASCGADAAAVADQEGEGGSGAGGSVFKADVPSAAVYEFSPQSLPCQVQQLSGFMRDLFPGQLVARDGAKVDTAARLAGKMVLIYFSAHWCGPCRQFTPLLAQAYQEMQAAGRGGGRLEVVFCSADHSEPEFKSYFQSMAPWLAIDYEDDERESFMGRFKVQGIPKLVVLAPDGRLVTDSGVSGGFSAAQLEQWLAQCGL